MNYADKLVLKPSNDLIEVTGVFSASQGFRIESQEKYLSVSIAGHIAFFPESLLKEITTPYIVTPKPVIIPQVQEIEEIKEEPKIKITKKRSK